MPERRPGTAPQRQRQSSREITRKIATLLREISAALAVPLAERGDEWAARVSRVQAHKDARVADTEATAAGQAVGPDPDTPGNPGTDTSVPAVVQ